MARSTKAGRNDPCPCGSGRKYKRCCEAKQARSRTSMVWMVAVAGAIVGAFLLGMASLGDDSAPAGPGRVWSAEHGHWH
jgi:SEC-C motif